MDDAEADDLAVASATRQGVRAEPGGRATPAARDGGAWPAAQAST
jgi:hypothetical protein